VYYKNNKYSNKKLTFLKRGYCKRFSGSNRIAAYFKKDLNFFTTKE